MVNSASIIEPLAAFAFLITYFPLTLIRVNYCLAIESCLLYFLSILPTVEALPFLCVESRATVGGMGGELEVPGHDGFCSAITAIARGGHG